MWRTRYDNEILVGFPRKHKFKPIFRKISYLDIEYVRKKHVCTEK